MQTTYLWTAIIALADLLLVMFVRGSGLRKFEGE